MALLEKTRTETLEDIKRQVAKLIANDVANLNEILIARYNSIMRLFWKNSKINPQHVSDSLGEDAAELFILGGKLTSLILDINPDAASELEVPLYPFTLNQDGTVTITLPPIEETPAEETPVLDPQETPPVDEPTPTE